MNVPGEAPVLRVEGLSVSAGGKALLRGVGLEAAAGQVVAVIGANGAGKTTLLEAMVGLRRAEGAIFLGGRRVIRFVDSARAFSFLPDAAPLPPEALVATVVDHALSVRPRPPDLVDALGRALDIAPLRAARVGVLSRGERQRVGLFAALAVDRPVVVLDEPFAPFDPLRLGEVLAALGLVTAAGSAIVASVHQLADAERLEARALILADGAALAFGDLAALRRDADLPGASLGEIFVALLRRGRDAA